MGFEVDDLGCKFSGEGFRVRGDWLRVWSLSCGLWVEAVGFIAGLGLRMRVEGSRGWSLGERLWVEG